MDVEPLAIVTTSLKRPITPRIERLEGFRKALRAKDVAVDERYIKNGEPEEMLEIFKELFSLDMPPKGIIAANDRIAQELMKYVKVQQIQVPEQLQIVIVDEVPYAEFMTPSLTTLEQPAIQMATKAAELLLQQINDETTQFPELLCRFKPTINKRYSTIEKP